MGFTKQHGKNLHRKMNHYRIHRGLVLASWILIHSLRERHKGKERQVKRNKRRYRYSVSNRLEGRRNNDRKEKREETGWKGWLKKRRKLLNVPPGLTLRLLISYIYGVPSKARYANVVYIWTYVWQRWNSLFLFAAQCFNTESMQRVFLCHICL